MPLFGYITIIKRNGQDGPSFPVTKQQCTLGRADNCDIRIQIPTVSREHCRITSDNTKESTIENLSEANKTQVNHKDVPNNEKILIKNKDIIRIGDRSFRWESI